MSMAAIIGRTIVRFEQVASTNDLAREYALRGQPEGLVVTAEEQVAGRGRQGRRWLAPPGTSLQMSILLRPPLAASQVWRLTPLAALALTSVLRDELGLAPALKWPNDVLLNGKKCAGILVETSIENSGLAFAIIGLGLNVNFSMRAYPELVDYATTVADELGRTVDREALEHALLERLDVYYARLRAGQDLSLEWRQQLVTLGQSVRVANGPEVLEGIAEGVDADGALILRSGDTRVRLYAGDVSIIKELPPRSGL